MSIPNRAVIEQEDTTKSIIDSFLFFLAYTSLRQRQQSKLGTRNLPVLNELSVGIAAGALSKFVTTPIQQIVTRKQTAAMISARDPTASVPMPLTKKLSVKDIALQIRSEKGLRGFWSGYSASLILTLNPALTFLLQNLIRRILAKSKQASLPGPKTLFLIAAISKAIASTITYPFSLAKSRAQVSTSPSDRHADVFSNPSLDQEKGKEGESLSVNDSPSERLKKPDLKDTSHPIQRSTRYAQRAVRVLLINNIKNLAVIRSLRQIYRTEGLMGLYSGLDADVAKGFLGHGLSMALKERIHVLIISAYYMLLKLTKRWPEELGSIRDQAGHELRRVTTSAGDIAVDAGERVRNVGETVAEGVKSAVAGGNGATTSEE